MAAPSAFCLDSAAVGYTQRSSDEFSFFEMAKEVGFVETDELANGQDFGVEGFVGREEESHRVAFEHVADTSDTVGNDHC